MDQDFVDSANGFWSVWLLVVFSLGSFLVRFITQPISCFPPAHFTGEHVEYAKDVCFRQDQFYIPTHAIIPTQKTLGMVPSYQKWIPLLLALQALGFIIPKVIWKGCKHYLSVNLEKTVSSLMADSNQAALKSTAEILTSMLRRNNFLLAILYLLVRLLYVANLGIQFVLLTMYFKPYISMNTFPFIGEKIGSGFNPVFMKIVVCDFDMRIMDNVQIYAVQCILNLSDIYENLYLFLWIWIIGLAVITNLNLLLWLGQLFIPFLKSSRVSVYLKSSSIDDGTVNRFVSDVLGIDGIFLVSMIYQNSNDTVAASLVQEMFREFEEKKKETGSQMSSGEPVVASSGYMAESTGSRTVDEVPTTCVNVEKPPIM